MYKLHTTCRACGYGPPVFAPGTKSGSGGQALRSVFKLGIQPLANDFVVPDGERQGFAPLEVLMCPRCGLAQLSVVVRPDILYGGNYLYVTSKSSMMQEHFARLWGDCTKLGLYRNVLEIGSNDGDFLDFCRGHGAEVVLGIEPAQNLAETARKRGIDTVCDFFGPESAAIATQRMPHIDMVFMRHVFCHVDDWMGLMQSLKIVADEDTVIYIEAPYVWDQLKANSFDQIYHEHLSYLSIRAMRALLDSGPFELEAIYHYPIHGGAIGLILRRRAAGVPIHSSVIEYLTNEDVTEETWKLFNQRCSDLISTLRIYVKGLVEQGKRVVGFGASAKSTVWINACGFTKHEISAVFDCTPEKWYRTIPGTDIPIMHEGAFYADAADFAVLFAWNFGAEILARQKKWIEGGSKFIVPVPSLRVIGLDSDTAEA